MADMQFMACPTQTLTGNRSASWTHLSYNITNFKTETNAKYELLSV
jgi:hypothetical protein